MKKSILLGLPLVLLFSFPSKQLLQKHLENVHKHKDAGSLIDKPNDKIIISEKNIDLEVFENWNNKNIVGININQNPMKRSSRQRRGKIIYSKYSKKIYKTEFE